jgi:hypothetical protein
MKRELRARLGFEPDGPSPDFGTHAPQRGTFHGVCGAWTLESFAPRRREVWERLWLVSHPHGRRAQDMETALLPVHMSPRFPSGRRKARAHARGETPARRSVNRPASSPSRRACPTVTADRTWRARSDRIFPLPLYGCDHRKQRHVGAYDCLHQHPKHPLTSLPLYSIATRQTLCRKYGKS